MTALMLTPGSDRSIEGLWAEMEQALTAILFEKASGGEFDAGDYDIRLIWTTSGFLDFDIQPKAHATAQAKAEARQSWLAFIDRRRFAGLLHRVKTFSGAGFSRFTAARSVRRFERRTSRRRRLSATIIAACAPHDAPTPIRVPP